jgi:hypothetical protein
MKHLYVPGFLFCAFFLNILSATYAQSIDKNEVKFNYIQLPLTPIENKVRNYDVVVIQNAEAKNAELKAAYEQKKADADKKYEMDLKAQEDMRNSQKSKVGSLLVAAGQMDPKNKIVKETVPEPEYLKVFPSELVSGKINIEGFTKSSTNAAIITLTLVGFEVTEPNIKSSGTDPNITYSYTIEYKYTVNAKVESQGKVYFDGLIPNSSKTFEYKPTSTFKTEADAKKNWADNSKALKDEMQSTSMSSSVSEANKLLNNNFGFMKMEREALVFSVKSKKMDYTDYNAAFTLLNEGFLMLGEDMLIEEGKTKIKEGVAQFETILKESNITDKKARINEDITIATYLNLLEANLWLNDFIACQKLILKIKTSNTSNKEERRMNRIKELIDDQKIRYDANNKI